jgi:hypothetical protein
MKYGTLRQRNPTCTPERWEELADLYVGGYALVDKASRYMPRFVGESRERYRERLAAASYLAYMGQIADYFVANLFSQELTLTQAADAKDRATPGEAPSQDGFWGDFAHDADLRGTSFVKLLRQVLTTALIKGKGLVVADLPTAVERAASLADEEASGTTRGYAFEAAPEELIDWEPDDRGGFAWAILNRQIIRRDSPASTRDRVVEEFKVWTLSGERAAWELFRTAPYKPNEPPKDEDDVPRAGGGTTTFRQIPILELAVPAGLWVGNKLGVLAREHFTRRSALNAAENKSLFAIPYVKLGPEVTAPGSAMPAEVQQNPGRGRDPRGEFNRRGYVVLGKDDDIGFAEPAGSAYELVDKQLDKLVDEMFRVVHQMASSVSATKQALARAAASKAEDRRATEIVLGAYGALVRDFAKRIYDCLSAARGESVVWTAHGLDKFELEDRDGILKEALALDAIAIPSTTFRATYKTKIALALVGNVPPETQDVIREEIERGVEQEKELDAHAQGLEPDEDDDSRDQDRPTPPGRSGGSPGAARGASEPSGARAR